MSITARLSDWYTNLSTHKKWFVKLLGVLTLVLIVVYIWFMPLRLIHMDLPIATSSDLARQGSHELWCLTASLFWRLNGKHTSISETGLNFIRGRVLGGLMVYEDFEIRDLLVKKHITKTLI